MKCDVSVRKEATINTGNYSTIKPSVEIKLKDVDVGNIDKVYTNLGIITAALFLDEMSSLSELQEEVKSLGLRRFFESIDKEEVKTDLNNAIKELYKDLFSI